MDTQLILELFILIIVLIIARIAFVIHKITTGFSRNAATTRTRPCKTIICIGSGGHTTEMLKLIENLDFSKYSPRYYIMASSDSTSEKKILTLEATKENSGSFNIVKIPRSRLVGQSFVTTIFTTLFSVIYSIPIVLRIMPDLILCNGPGTCIPVCGIAFLLKCAFIKDIKTVFVESFCRTQTFSLSGKILVYIADNFLVQWPDLKTKMKRAEYIGQLM